MLFKDLSELDALAIKTIKINGVAAINLANSGHPGIVLGAAKILHTLFTRHMIFNPKKPNWINRDRFVLSAGHGSALLYAQLRLLGLISETELKNFRKLDSVTPGHPEIDLNRGIEATTGPLGQGIAMAVGIAIAEAHLNSKFKEIDHYTYVLCGDGDLQEGVASESLSFAGHQKLNKLIVIHDSNDIQLDSEVSNVFSEDLRAKMEALGFSYQLVSENNVNAIDNALINAKKSLKPSFIEVKTTIGEGATNANTTKVHGSPLGDDFENLKKVLEWEKDDFWIPDKVIQLYEKTIIQRSLSKYNEFKMSFELQKYCEFKKNCNYKIDFRIAKNLATRESSGIVNDHLSKHLPFWIGGSADLSVSTKIKGADGLFSPTNRQGRDLQFGVREFAMASMANGISLHSFLKVFVSTFFVFADYLKPALRLSALMRQPITYIFTHDSIFLGEDGPTHEPIEQTALVRSIPNVNFVRPGDEKEVIGAYQLALNSTTKPTIIAVTRQKIISLEETSSQQILNGAYYIYRCNSLWNIVASGSELSNALLLGKEMGLNVISLSNSCTNIFWNPNYTITIEAATTFGMSKYGKYNIGIDTFGASGPGKYVYQKFGFDYDSLKKKIQKIII